MKIIFVCPISDRRDCFSAEMEDMEVEVIGVSTCKEAEQVILENPGPKVVVVDIESNSSLESAEEFKALRQLIVSQKTSCLIVLTSRFHLKDWLIKLLGSERVPIQD